MFFTRIVIAILLPGILANAAVSAPVLNPSGQRDFIGETFQKQALSAPLSAGFRSPAGSRVWVQAAGLLVIGGALPLWGATEGRTINQDSFRYFEFMFACFILFPLIPVLIEYESEKLSKRGLKNIDYVFSAVFHQSLLVAFLFLEQLPISWLIRTCMQISQEHPTATAFLDAAMGVLLLLGLRQRLDQEKWARSTITTPVEMSETIFYFSGSRTTAAIFDSFLIVYAFTALGSDILYLLPLWGAVRGLIHGLILRRLTTKIRRWVQIEKGPVKAVSIFLKGFVFWDREPDVLRFAGFLLVPMEYIVPMDGWDPLWKRAGRKLRGFFPSQATSHSQLGLMAA